MEEKTEPVMGLSDALTEDGILIKTSVSDWKDALRKTGELMLKQDAIEPRFIDAMINLCINYNAYIVIAPGIALGHARPEDGAKKPCLTLMTLKDPVKFGHPTNDPVDLVLGLCCPDHKSHIKALAQLAEILMDKNKLAAFRNAKTKETILEIIRGQSN